LTIRLLSATREATEILELPLDTIPVLTGCSLS